MSKQTQTDKVRYHLINGGSATPKEAVQWWDIWRLAAIIHKLKKEGFRIETRTETTSTGARYARYKMSEDKPFV